jgi:hypothetical protein
MARVIDSPAGMRAADVLATAVLAQGRIRWTRRLPCSYFRA